MSKFHGSDYIPARDDKRLGSQLDRIRDYMLGHGEFRTLEEIAADTHSPHASVSAQLRHLTTAKHGGYVKNKRYLGNGLFSYQIQPPLPLGQIPLFQEARA